MTRRQPPTTPSISPRALVFHVLALVLFLLAFGRGLSAQTESAALSGTIVDRSGALVPNAHVTIVNVDTNVTLETKTNSAGVYNLPFLKPGHYRILVTKEGFKQIDLRDVILSVQDSVSRNFTLDVGGISETIIVHGGVPLINTESAGVGTVVTREQVENMPLNGRSFQSLITLTPGIVLVPADSPNASGQFSVNGQRADANYFVVDGVSANVGNNGGFPVPGQATSGSLPSLTVAGGTQSLASVDAMQEFRVQTSTYAAEYGRQPGGQISIVTRSGTNQFHGTVFDYFRNEALDANDWFNNHNGIPRPPERQNDFGGVFGGPIIKDRTFVFFSYEGLRLQTPTFSLTNVPTVALRQNAPAALQPILNAFPLPLPNARDLGNGLAEFAAGYSNPTSLDAMSIRIDHTFNSRVAIFGRYGRTPSSGVARAAGANLSLLNLTNLNAQFLTLGSTIRLTSQLLDELRANYTSNSGTVGHNQDKFGGAALLPFAALVPSQYAPPGSAADGGAIFFFQGGTALGFPSVNVSRVIGQSQSQFNLVDNLSYAAGSHQLKFGVDYRRLAPVLEPPKYGLTAFFLSQDAILNSTADFVEVDAGMRARPIYVNFSAYGQDSWKLSRRLTLDLGLRWDLNPAPKEADGKDPFTVIGLNNLATMQLAPQGTPLWKTTHNNFAPRVGAAYLIREHPGWETVIRGGFGAFFDTGNNLGSAGYSGWPFFPSIFLSNVAFPIDISQVAPPGFSLAPPFGILSVFDPNLKLPYTLQWSFAIQQSLGTNQAITASYLGNAGRRLLQTQQLDLRAINPNFTFVNLATNHATSDYDALQLQFQRRPSHGVQALASYTWSHAQDEDSRDNGFFVPRRGNCTCDMRHNFQAAVTYEIPGPQRTRVFSALLDHWSLDSRVFVQSALPVNPPISSGIFINPANGSSVDAGVDVVVPRVPFYVDDPTVPGGRRINSNAFAPVPVDSNGVPTRQGTLGRNVVRGFGAWQVDLAVRRQFNLTERVNLQFRAEAFNLANHPNFGLFDTSLQSPTFGEAQSMLRGPLAGLNSLYQIGGPRSLQIALKLAF